MKTKAEKPKNPTPKKTKRPSRWHSLEEIAVALKKSHGFVTHAARELGMTHPSLSERIKKNPELQTIIEECDEEKLDLGEMKLLQAMNAGEAWAICFFLKCKGKKRGYTEKQEIEHSGPEGGPIETKDRSGGPTLREVLNKLAPESQRRLKNALREALFGDPPGDDEGVPS